MTQSEFISETNKMERFYSKELSNFQSEIWYKTLRVLSKERYERIVGEVFKRFKTMPKLANILEIAFFSELLKRFW